MLFKKFFRLKLFIIYLDYRLKLENRISQKDVHTSTNHNQLIDKEGSLKIFILTGRVL